MSGAVQDYCTECPEPECCDAGWPCAEVQAIHAELTSGVA